jgi:hypothetical protein
VKGFHYLPPIDEGVLRVTEIPAVDDRVLVAYLLGTLGEEQTERIEQLTIENDDLAAQLRIVENDLVDGYVRQTLSRRVRRRFEANYLSSARRRRRVQAAERFLAVIDRGRPNGCASGCRGAAAEPVAGSNARRCGRARCGGCRGRLRGC